MRYRPVLVLTACAATALLAGCGGPKPVARPLRPGAVVVALRWPVRGRLIPVATDSLGVCLNGAATARHVTVDRPTQDQESIVTFTDLLPGDYVLVVEAYPQRGAAGVLLARGEAAVAVQDGRITVCTVALRSTVERMEVRPSDTLVLVGSARPLVATARDANGNVVPLSPGKTAWASSDPDVASVDDTGAVTGVAMGSARITATDTESGVSGATTVTVVQPMVVVQFDDGHRSIYTDAFPIMKQRGIVGTAYVIADRVGRPGSWTLADLQEMHAAGWAICNHTQTHPHLTAVPASQVAEELAGGMKWLRSHGFTRDEEHRYLAYLYGMHDPTVDAAVLSLDILIGRGSTEQPFVPLVDWVRTAVPSRSIDRLTPATIKQWVDTVAETGGTLLLHGHALNKPNFMDSASFAETMDYLVAMRPRVLTVTLPQWHQAALRVTRARLRAVGPASAAVQ